MTAALHWYRPDLWPRGINREPRESFCTTNITMQRTDCLLRTGGEKSQLSPSVRISGSQLASAHAATSESSYPAKGSMWKQRATPRNKDKSFGDNKASSKQVLLNKCCGPLVLLVPSQLPDVGPAALPRLQLAVKTAAACGLDRSFNPDSSVYQIPRCALQCVFIGDTQKMTTRLSPAS